MAPKGSTGQPAQAKRGRRIQEFMTPLRRAPRQTKILVYDNESKDGETDLPGFTRPFMVGFLDHEDQYTAFWDDPSIQYFHSDFRKRTIKKGGCIDSFARFIFGYPKEEGQHYSPPNRDFCYPGAEIYAHNGGRFDTTPLLVWLYRHTDEFIVHVTSVQGRAQRVMVRVRNKPKICWCFTDSALVLQMKLETATALFSKDKKKLDNFDLYTPEKDRAKWEEYNALDCRGLRDALTGFRAMIESEGGELGMTCPATGMKLFRRKHLHKNLYRARCFPGCKKKCRGCDRKGECDKRCHGCLHEWIRSGLHGGRTEIFDRFSYERVFYYDLNSSYPAAALLPMPVGQPKIQTGEEFLSTHEKLHAQGKIGFVECTVYIPPGCPIPPLPHVVEGKLCFPTGTFSGVFEYDELSLIFDPFVGGKLVRVERAVWFTGEPILASYMLSLYEHRLRAPVDEHGRKKKDPKKMTEEERGLFALAEWAKLMMNAPIGKFATDPEREEIFFINPSHDPLPIDAKPMNGRHEGGGCIAWARKQYIDACYIIPQINARVTALGRRAWWLAARDQVLAGGRVHYGDTDCIQCSKPFPEHLVDEVKLGKWKEEHTDADFDGEWLQPKNYALNDRSGGPAVVHMKGVPRDHQNMRTFMRIRNGEQLRWVNDRTSQHKTVLRGLAKNGPEGIFMQDSIKRLRSQYDKRIVHEDGSTSALVLVEGKKMEAS